jgi:hypothetical protein
VLRASAVCEAAGVPTSSLICEGFIKQARATSVGLGYPNLPVAGITGHPNVQSIEDLRANTLDTTLEQVIRNLTRTPPPGSVAGEPQASEVVFKGSFEEVNEHFSDNEWSDGLPIVPPTRQRTEQFLRFCNDDPNRVIGVMLPDNRAATVWSVAVNGVMAGCRPQYMPILIALVEAMADARYGMEHSGNTPGSEAVIILNGPIIQQLGFNYTQGVMRDGFRPNTSIGRFFRLYLRNVVGFLPHKTDKGTFGGTWRVVTPENEEVLRKIGWKPLSVDMGFSEGDNTVTIARYSGGNVLASVAGVTPETLLPYVADGVVRQMTWQFNLTAESKCVRPLVMLSPILAETIAAAGWSKAMVREYLYEHARAPAWQLERQKEWQRNPNLWDLKEKVARGELPPEFAESDDPNRMVPLVGSPDDYLIVVTGDPLRTNAQVLSHNGRYGYTVAKKIRVVEGWEAI